MFNKSAHKGLKRIIKGLISYIGILLLLGMWGCCNTKEFTKTETITKDTTLTIPVPEIHAKAKSLPNARIDSLFNTLPLTKNDIITTSIKGRGYSGTVKYTPATHETEVDITQDSIKATAPKTTIKNTTEGKEIIKTNWGKILGYSATATILLVLLILFFIWRIKA